VVSYEKLLYRHHSPAAILSKLPRSIPNLEGREWRRGGKGKGSGGGEGREWRREGKGVEERRGTVSGGVEGNSKWRSQWRGQWRSHHCAE
jgi:hypothetical protein